MSNSARSSSLRDHQHHHHYHYNYPSFSSSLLEEIYRSFDDDLTHSHSDGSYRIKKSSSCLERDQVNRFVLDQWMDNEKINLRRKSMPVVTSDGNFQRPMMMSSSSTSSSDSSSGIGGFSSSDTESLYGSSKPKNSSLKPIRTTVNQPELHRKCCSNEIPASKKNKKEGNLHRRALKLYGDLKKVKQPISPGGKLASFLNSLFTSSASKKPKISSSTSSTSSNGLKLSMSTPSTASSYSRSCLSKTPSSTGRFERRSVRFCPVSVIVDEDCRPCGQKSVYNDDIERDYRRKNDVVSKMEVSVLASDKDFKVQLMEKHRRVEEVAKELLKNYHGRKLENDVKNNIRGFRDEDEEEEEDDDERSCCSSDLFELENLLEIGVDGRYREELPVYETTHVGTNRAIANGFIL